MKKQKTAYIIAIINIIIGVCLIGKYMYFAGNYNQHYYYLIYIGIFNIIIGSVMIKNI